MVKFGFLTVPRWAGRETAELFKLAEDVGMEYAWVADYANSQCPYSVLTMTALTTRKVKLGPCSTNPYTRHPAVTAASMATINELSNGRAILGMAAGDEATLRSMGIAREAPATAIREAVEVIRKIVSGETVNYEGRRIKLSGFRLFYKPTQVFPIYIGARGPQILRLAGEIADGVLLDMSHPLEVKMALEKVKEGVASAKRDVKELDLATCTIFSVGKKLEDAKRSVRWIVALMTSSAPREVLERHKIDYERAEAVRHAIAKEGLDKAATLVTDEMIEAFSVTGTPDHCISVLEKLAKTELTQIILSNVGFSSESIRKHLEIIGAEILPHFRT